MMKFNHKMLSIFFGGLIIIGIIGTVATYNISNDLQVWDAWDESREVAVYTIENVNVRNLIVHADVSDVIILPAEDESIRIEFSGMRASEVLQVNEAVDTLTVDVRCDRGVSFIGFGFRRYEEILTIYMPTSLYENIDVSNDVGDIDISGILATEITVRNDVGDIYLKCDGFGLIDVRSSIGNISLEVANVNRNIQLKNDVGDIEFLVGEEPENVRIMASSTIGSVNSNLADTYFGNAENLVNLITEIGNIDIRLVR